MHDRALDRQRGAGGTVPVKQVEVVVDGRTLMATTPIRALAAGDLEHDIAIFSAEAEGGASLDAAGDAAAKLPLHQTATAMDRLKLL